MFPTNTVRILIVEDEMIIAESISDMLEELGFEVTGIHMRAKSALKALRQTPPDIALLDINLKGDEDGIWLANQVKDEAQFPIIFLTSYGDQKTIDRAVETSPYGYILKPIEKQTLYSTIQVALKKFDEAGAGLEQDGMVLEDSFFVKENFEYVKVKVDAIDFIKSDDNYIEISTGSKKHLVRSTLKAFHRQLPSSQFVQVHRSFVINLEKISAFSPTYVSINAERIPVAKKYQSNLMDLLKTVS